MVKIRRRRDVPRSPQEIAALSILTVLLLCALPGGMYVADMNHELSLSQMPASPLTISTADDERIQLKTARQHIDKLCQTVGTKQEMANLTKAAENMFTFMSSPPSHHDNSVAVKHCRRVVMDFGANIGDTSGHVIDSGFPQCERSELKLKGPLIHFNVESKEWEEIKRRNPLTHHLIKMMSERSLGPEDYCYYGIEGNPVFTKRLRAIEDFVMAMQPRPIQHMHFFTESVGAGKDGPTKLYLDTVNTGKNFWGSSIFKDHQDVRKSAENATSIIAADVMGYTIGGLMRKTLKAFDQSAPPEDRSGNHLVLKVDIEGGEYPLLYQAAEEGALCEFVKNGNTADLFIEFHSQRVTGRHDYLGKKKQIVERLEACGVNFRNLEAWWA
jgi:hypothetical protein